MKSLPRLCGLFLLLAWLPAGWAQFAGPPVARIHIKHVGPPAASDDFIRAHLRLKVGDPYLLAAADDDVRNLYATGLFYNIQIVAEDSLDGRVLTYKVQGNPRLTDITFQGNTRFKNTTLLKKISSKRDEPMDERKLFTDAQEIRKLYQQKGYPRVQVEYERNIDENAGRATATFKIAEAVKIKIVGVDFIAVEAGYTPPLQPRTETTKAKTHKHPGLTFSAMPPAGGLGQPEEPKEPLVMAVGTKMKESKLRRVVKTRRHWMFSWITRHGFLKEDELEDDKARLTKFYRDQGYIDFEIKQVQFGYPTPKTLVVRFLIYEGVQYKVGSVKFTGNNLFSTAEIAAGLRLAHARDRSKAHLGPNGLPMDVGGLFTPGGLASDIQAVEDFYGAKGYLDVRAGSRNLKVLRIPNTETGAMDLEFQLDEGQKFKIEKIEIRGNIRTRDHVIRRELAVSPGDTFDMVRVKRSKGIIEQLEFFERVDTRAEPTDVVNGKNLVIEVKDKDTGHFSLGAGFSSVDSLVGIVEMKESNFNLSDPFQPPWFRGGGQKLRLLATVGFVRQDYEIGFIEPWFLDRKLHLGVDVYYRNYSFLSPNDLYEETRGGGRLSLESPLGSDFLLGRVSLGVEDVGIRLTSDAILPFIDKLPVPFPGLPIYVENPGNVPKAIRDEVGHDLLTRFGASLAYDTRNNVRLPDKGQRTSLEGEVVALSNRQFYKLELKTGWYFRGLAKGHVLELVGRVGVAQALGTSADVPFYERYYLGGPYDLRGFRYRSVSPRERGYDQASGEPIGGDSYWFASAEYSLPIFQQARGIGIRFAIFYDIGNVGSSPYNFNPSHFLDNWGVGLRINLPLGPLRLDYGIPIHYDKFNSSSGQFQFTAGWTRQF